MRTNRSAIAISLLVLVACGPGTPGDDGGAISDSVPATASPPSGDTAARPAGPEDGDGPRSAATGDSLATGRTASEDSLLAAARDVAGALADRDFEALAQRVDPERGVLLAPYSYVEPDDHATLTAQQLRAVVAGDSLSRRWGTYDGSGDPIELSFREYVDRFVYDRAYLEDGEVAIDERQGRGSSLDNAAEVWPDARIVEYHVPGTDPRYGGMDWRSLRLVLVDRAGQWRLVGIVHDEWTI